MAVAFDNSRPRRVSASRSHHTHTALCRSLLKTCTCSLLGRKLLPASPGIAGHTSLQRKTMILLRILSHIPLCSGECGSYRNSASESKKEGKPHPLFCNLYYINIFAKVGVEKSLSNPHLKAHFEAHLKAKKKAPKSL